jgi:simple sugar transport system permease protein
MKRLRIKLVERKVSLPIWAQLMYVLAGLFAALFVSSILIRISGASVFSALTAIFRGAFGDWDSVAETLVQTTPLIFTGSAVVIAFRGRVWNIGAEGQFYAGALAASWVSLNLVAIPRPLLLTAIILAALIAGALWALVPAVLKAMFKTNEVIVTVMMNYIIIYLLSFLLSGPWKQPGEFYLQTAYFDEIAQFPLLFAGSRLHLGFLLAVGTAVIAYLLLWKTPLGFKIRAIGVNPIASEYKGIDVPSIMVVTLLLSGAIAGLAGGSEIAGVHHRLRMGISTGYGYTGILIALLGRLHPVGVIIASVFFGALINGSTAMQIYTGVPVALVYSVQGIVLICLLVAEVFSTYRLQRIVHDR